VPQAQTPRSAKLRANINVFVDFKQRREGSGGPIAFATVAKLRHSRERGDPGLGLPVVVTTIVKMDDAVEIAEFLMNPV
jgi:hypothetical protein